ncbi:MAG: argininosuccinate lyase [Legionellales bacterium]|nr:argininosuccinate lyase [Legionellales bacterium]
MSKKLWGGRFNMNTLPEVECFTSSIEVDQELAYDDILGSMAHAAMLGECDILTQSESRLLQQGLLNIAHKLSANEVDFQIEDEDIHMNIERLLYLELGEVAGKLHTARSRNDQVALDLHLYLRRQTIDIIDLLLQLQSTLIELAQSSREIILPGYTHLQRAQPVFLAQYWLAYSGMLQRDILRLKDGWGRINQSPLGAGALNGSTMGIDKNYVAAILKFDSVYSSSMDAVSDRDFVIEFLSAASLIMAHLSRLSEELILWSSQEFNFISMSDEFCTGSSMMPQKKNPDVAELTRGKTARVYGSLMSLLTLLKGLPLTYNRDLQEDKEPLFDTVKTVRSVLSVYAPLLRGIKINAERMSAATENGFLNATALAEYLVKKKVAFRQAHEIVGKMVAYCVTKNCSLESLTLDEMQAFSELIDHSVYDALNLKNIAVLHDTNNHKGRSSIAVEIEGYQKKMQNTANWVAEKRQLLQEVIAHFGIE